MIHRPTRLVLAMATVAIGASHANAALIFSITNQGAATSQMMAGVTEAAALWSSRLEDSITINVRINAAVLPAGQIAGTNPFYDPYAYTDVRNALTSDKRSAEDLSSTNALQPGPAISVLINRTANNPNGIVSATPYFDTGLGGPGEAGPENNSTIRIPSANAKAIGLIPGNSAGLDGTITFSTAQAYDFDRSNGINAGEVDFVGVAAHEIGHLLGFLSGIDTLAGNGVAPGLSDNQLRFITPLDLFRFSSRSIGGGTGVIDWTADNTVKYFSADGGATALATFSNGATFGDGYEAHHWKDNLGLGLMDPTVSSGEMLALTGGDLRALDVIGYDLAAPEPSTGVLLAIGCASLLFLRRS